MPEIEFVDEVEFTLHGNTNPETAAWLEALRDNPGRWGLHPTVYQQQHIASGRASYLKKRAQRGLLYPGSWEFATSQKVRPGQVRLLGRYTPDES